MRLRLDRADTGVIISGIGLIAAVAGVGLLFGGGAALVVVGLLLFVLGAMLSYGEG